MGKEFGKVLSSIGPSSSVLFMPVFPTLVPSKCVLSPASITNDHIYGNDGYFSATHLESSRLRKAGVPCLIAVLHIYTWTFLKCISSWQILAIFSIQRLSSATELQQTPKVWPSNIGLQIVLLHPYYEEGQDADGIVQAVDHISVHWWEISKDWTHSSLNLQSLQCPFPIFLTKIVVLNLETFPFT